MNILISPRACEILYGIISMFKSQMKIQWKKHIVLGKVCFRGAVQQLLYLFHFNYFQFWSSSVPNRVSLRLEITYTEVNTGYGVRNSWLPVCAGRDGINWRPFSKSVWHFQLADLIKFSNKPRADNCRHSSFRWPCIKHNTIPYGSAGRAVGFQCHRFWIPNPSALVQFYYLQRTVGTGNASRSHV